MAHACLAVVEQACDEVLLLLEEGGCPLPASDAGVFAVAAVEGMFDNGLLMDLLLRMERSNEKCVVSSEGVIDGVERVDEMPRSSTTMCLLKNLYCNFFW